MPESPETFYVTTPIYYVNARPHIGHAYTTIVADVLARRHRLLGQDVFFLTGTDEHGQKIERSAIAAGIPPQQFADQVSQSFRALWQRMGVTYTDYIRTTEPRHKQGVQHLFTTLQQNGFISKGTYTGQYCVSDEAYVDGPPGIHCPDCGRLTETVSEENYYFKLSAFQLPLLDLIESDTLKIRPDSARNEVLSFLRGNLAAAPPGEESPGAPFMAQSHRDMSGNVNSSPSDLPRTAANTPYVPGALKDLSISRTSFSWGVPVPGDERHVIYVWLDALANYMTALGYGSDDTTLFDRFWPANLHLVGKEITRFHCVYWPAFLLAANLPLPKEIVANGWLLFDNAKMSKSKGNVVRTETILTGFGDQFPRGIEDHNARELKKDPTFQPVPEPTAHERDLFATDVLRYFLLREIPFGQDGSFSFDAMITRYNADLANGYGNLVSRTLAMIEQNLSGSIPHTDAAHHHGYSLEEAQALLAPGTDVGVHTQASTAITVNTWNEAIDGTEFARALDAIATGVGIADGYITHKTPWKLAKADDAESRIELQRVLYTAAESIRILTALLYPILPFSTARVWAQLGLGSIEEAAARGDLNNLRWGGLQPGTKLGPLSPIFPRADKGLAQTMADLESTPAPSLLNVANDEHDATPTDHTGFREAPLASVPAGTTDQLFAAETASESHTPSAAQSPGAPSTAQSHRAMGGNVEGSLTPVPAEPTGSFSTDLAAGPRTSTLPVQNPIAQVAGSTPTTTAAPSSSAHTHVDAEPSGIFASTVSATPVSATPADASPQITIDDFAKVELRVARIVVAERIPKADKLLRLEVDLGHEKRQILSGIAEWYTPESLVGRLIVVITNLAPRKMRGLDSHGMLLAASGPLDPANSQSAKPVLATFTEDIPLGSRLK